MEHIGTSYAELCALAQSDPETFEEYAEQLIAKVVESGGPHLKSYQERLNRNREAFPNAGWLLFIEKWQKISVQRTTHTVMRYISSRPSEYAKVLAKYQQHLYCSLNPFIFEDWNELYEKDPEGAERLRLQVIEEHLCYSSVDTQKGRDFQEVIDTERAKSKTVFGSFQYLQCMFFDLVFGDDGFCEKVSHAFGTVVPGETAKIEAALAPEVPKGKQGVVIPFSKTKQ